MKSYNRNNNNKNSCKIFIIKIKQSFMRFMILIFNKIFF